MPDEQPVTPEITAAPATKAKKEKPPALEDKPFAEFIQEHYLPSLREALSAKGIQDLSLIFERGALPSVGGDCWQVKGIWAEGQRRFLVGFAKEDINSTKVFAYADGGVAPSYLEPFLGDERKMSLILMVARLVQRLDGQKWLTRN